MKPRIIIRLVATIEFEPNPALYPPGASLHDMADIDVKNAINYPHLFLDMDNVKVEVESNINHPIRCAMCGEQFYMHGPHICKSACASPAPKPDDLEEHNRNEANDYKDEQ